MSGFECTESNDLGLFGIDVHILGFQCDDQGGAFAVVLVMTLVIKLLQNKLWAAQAQRQRELLQMEKDERVKGCWDSPLAWLLLLEFISTVIGILSVLVIMGANAFIFLVIILSNLVGTGWTYAHMEKDHHSTSKDILNMCELLKEAQGKDASKMDAHMQCKVQQATLAMTELKRQLKNIDLDNPAVIVKTANVQELNHRLAFNF